MNETNKTNKNKRGRPRNSPMGGTMVSIWIPTELRDRLRELGGSKWIVSQLRKTMEK